MLFMHDRPRIPVRPPRPPAADDRLLGRISPAEMAARVARPPYRDTWRVVERRARSARRAGVTSVDLPERRRAEHLIALALSAWVNGSSARRRLAEEALEVTGRGAWGNWCSAPEALTRYMLALDLLRAQGPVRRGHIPVELIGQFVAGGVAVNDQLPKNNWQVGALSAIGLTALTFWHMETPWPVRDWLEIALDGLSRLLYGLLSEEGAYLEGPGYSRRSLVAFLPFAWALKFHTGVDLINHPSVARWTRWGVEVATPDGANPPIDDSRPENIQPWALLCHPQCRQARLFRWAFERMGLFDEHWEEYALFLYDDRIRPKPPADPPTQVLVRSGMARFRSDWSPNATYGLLLSRPAPPLGPGQSDSAHRHDDPTHFVVFAGGELLALDAGYGGYGHPDRYRWILTPEAHNVILVDGLGPDRQTYFRPGRYGPNVSTAHGRIRDVFHRKGLHIARAETTYRQVDFTRWMAFVRDQYFVILDVVESAARHHYAWVLHGAGRLRFSGARRAQWRTRRNRLDVHWIQPTDLALTRHVGRHYFGHGPGAEHEYIKAGADGKNRVFLTVLLPAGRDGAAPEVLPCEVEGRGVGVTVRHADERAEHFAFDPWGEGVRARPGGGRFRRIKGAWTVWFEAPGGFRRAGP